jgi:WD40 repeat protein
MVSGVEKDAPSGNRKVVLSGHSAQVNRVIYAPDGRTIVTASDDKTIRFWNTETGRERAVLRGH